MRLIKSILAALSLTLAAGFAQAGPGNPQNGLDYLTLAKPQSTDAAGKVEVIEFFGYFCPHCYALDPVLAEWVKKQGDKIVFKRIHVQFHPTMVPIQQMYVALELMGKTEELHKKVFDAMHKQRLRLDTEPAVTEFVTRQGGIDKQKYLDVLNSFSAQTKMRRVTQALEAYGISSVPQIIIDGRFQTSPDQMRTSLGNQPEPVLASALTQVMDALVDKVAKEQGKKK